MMKKIEMICPETRYFALDQKRERKEKQSLSDPCNKEWKLTWNTNKQENWEKLDEI